MILSAGTPSTALSRYLTRKDRALASDYLNIDSPDLEHPDAAFDIGLRGGCADPRMAVVQLGEHV